MILNKYILKRFLKVEFAILAILLLIFEFQQIIKVLNEVVEGNIPSDLILHMSVLGIPFISQVILPLSLFLSIIFVLSRLHADSEIIAMQACGGGKSIILKPVIFVIITTTIISLINVFWVCPWSLAKRDIVLEEAKVNPKITNIVQGQFIDFVQDNFVLFAEDSKGSKDSKLKGIYIFQVKPYKKLDPSVLTAREGSMEILPDKTRVLKLKNVFQYEGDTLRTDFNIIHSEKMISFLDYQSAESINENLSKEDITSLWQNVNQSAERLELIWRLDLILVCIIMGIVAIPLSRVESRQGKYAKILPAILIFMIYFLSQNAIKRANINFVLSKEMLMFILNIGFIVFGIMLNLRDAVFIRRQKQYIKSRIR